VEEQQSQLFRQKLSIYFLRTSKTIFFFSLIEKSQIKSTNYHWQFTAQAGDAAAAAAAAPTANTTGGPGSRTRLNTARQNLNVTKLMLPVPLPPRLGRAPPLSQVPPPRPGPPQARLPAPRPPPKWLLPPLLRPPRQPTSFRPHRGSPFHLRRLSLVPRLHLSLMPQPHLSLVPRPPLSLVPRPPLGLVPRPCLSLALPLQLRPTLRCRTDWCPRRTNPMPWPQGLSIPTSRDCKVALSSLQWQQQQVAQQGTMFASPGQQLIQHSAGAAALMAQQLPGAGDLRSGTAKTTPRRFPGSLSAPPVQTFSHGLRLPSQEDPQWALYLGRLEQRGPRP
jgi:hypothetical protein